MARRAGAETIEVEASHSVALSQPQVVAEVIHAAAERTSVQDVAVGSSLR